MAAQEQLLLAAAAGGEAGLSTEEQAQLTVVERAWSSPIWLLPAALAGTAATATGENVPTNSAASSGSPS